MVLVVNDAERKPGQGRDTDKPSSGFRPKHGQRFWLRFGGHETPLKRGRYLIGRGKNCHLRLESELVSREHATVTVLDDRLVLEDLGSRNGICVDGQRVDGSIEITGAATIGVADVHIPVTLRSDVGGQQPTQTDLRAVRIERKVDDYDDDVTLRASSFELLGQVVEKALALGRTDEAEHLLTGHLAMFLTEAESGISQKPKIRTSAARHAVSLARATGKAAWVDYCFKLYLAANAVVPPEIVDELYHAVRKAPAVDRPLLRKYLLEMKAQTANLTPNDRFALQRLDGLIRLTGHL